jgi:hypothetical protein
MMSAIATREYGYYKRFSEEEEKIIEILKDRPGIVAKAIYAYFQKEWPAKNALHHLASKKVVFNENFRWYLNQEAL